MASVSISYILLTYNQRDTVRAAVLSALAQNVQPMEIVISDDCSSDNTFTEIESIVEQYPGPHSIILNRNPKNLGLAGNLAKVHELSTGDLIIAAAGDDISLPHRSQRILETFVDKKPLLICSYAKVVGPNDAPITGDFKRALFYKGNWDLKHVARSKSLYFGATGAWNRSLYSEFGPIGPETYEDLVLGFRAALYNRISVIEEELVQYRLGYGITSSQGYQTDIAAFEKWRMKGLVAQKAVMHQRIEDATQFGLNEKSPVFRILEREAVKAELGLSYYKDNPCCFFRNLLAHPILALVAWRNEIRRRRKFKRKLGYPVQSA